RVRQARSPLPASAIGPLLAVAGIIEILAEQPQVRADLPGVVYERLRRHGVGADGRAARTEDMGLLPTDLFPGVAQILGVVYVHAGDDGAIRIDDVHRVQAPAQADFQHGRVHALFLEQQQGGQRGELEVRQGDVLARSVDARELRGDLLVRGQLAVQADAF